MPSRRKNHPVLFPVVSLLAGSNGHQSPGMRTAQQVPRSDRVTGRLLGTGTRINSREVVRLIATLSYRFPFPASMALQTAHLMDR